MKTCACCGKEYPDDVGVCAQDRTPLVAGMAARLSPISPQSSTRLVTVCPACGGLADCPPVVQPRGSFSLSVFLAGGLLAVLFHNASQPKRVRCVQCETVFSIRAPCAKVSGVFFWLLIAPAGLAMVILLIHLLTLLLVRG